MHATYKFTHRVKNDRFCKLNYTAENFEIVKETTFSLMIRFFSLTILETLAMELNISKNYNSVWDPDNVSLYEIRVPSEFLIIFRRT